MRTRISFRFVLHILCIIFLWFIYYFVVVMLAYVKYWYCICAEFFFVNFFSHVFSFRFVFGDFPTTASTAEPLSTVPTNARKFPFISDVLRWNSTNINTFSIRFVFCLYFCRTVCKKKKELFIYPTNQKQGISNVWKGTFWKKRNYIDRCFLD